MSLADDAMYDLGPFKPGTIADDQIELEECAMVCTSSVSVMCQRCAGSVSEEDEIRTGPNSESTILA